MLPSDSMRRFKAIQKCMGAGHPPPPPVKLVTDTSALCSPVTLVVSAPSGGTKVEPRLL